MRLTLISIAVIAVLLTGCADNNASTDGEPASGDPGFAPGGPPVGGADGGPPVGGGGAPSAVAMSNARRAWERLSVSEQADVCDRYDSRNGPTKTRRDLIAGKLALSEPDMTRDEVASTMIIIRQRCS